MPEGGGLLEGKTILIVDDEPDILEVLEELLSMCNVVKASTFKEAKELLESQNFDLAILDIMGVDGYRLLSLAYERGIMAVMLTAHALSAEDAKRSFNEGASYYIPKDRMADIATYLNEVLEAKDKGKNPWHNWLGRFHSIFEKRFGPAWQEKDKEFWGELKYKI